MIKYYKNTKVDQRSRFDNETGDLFRISRKDGYTSIVEQKIDPIQIENLSVGFEKNAEEITEIEFNLELDSIKTYISNL